MHKGFHQFLRIQLHTGCDGNRFGAHVQFHFRNLFLCGGKAGKGIVYPGKKYLPVCVEEHPSISPVEQLHSQRLFQPLDCVAEVWLRDMQLLCGPRNVLKICHGSEIFELCEIRHVGHLPLWPFGPIVAPVSQFGKGHKKFILFRL